MLNIAAFIFPETSQVIIQGGYCTKWVKTCMLVKLENDVEINAKCFIYL